MSGTKHDSGKPKLSIIPTDALWGMAKALTYGASKYSLHNFRNGIHYTRLADAAMRHLTVWMEGEELDKESGNSHLDHAMASLAMLKFMSVHRKEFDDRWIKTELEKSDCICGEINARNCPVHQQNEPQYETNIQEFEKFFGLSKEQFLKFKDEK